MGNLNDFTDGILSLPIIMHSLFRLLLVMALLALATPAVGITAEDPSGDVEYDLGAAGRHPAPDVHGDVDLVRVSLTNETPASFDLQWHVVGSREGDVPSTAFTAAAEFVFRQTRFLVRAFPIETGMTATLSVIPADGAPRHVADLEAYADDERQTVRATLTKELLVPSEPRPAVGESLTGLTFWTEGRPYTFDMAPNDEVLTYVFEQAHATWGHLEISPDLLRASNGGAEVHLFQIHVTNHGPDDVVRVETMSVPTGWRVITSRATSIERGETAPIPVIAGTQSAHSHGSAASIELALSSAANASVQTTLKAVVRYVEPAQPGGHHPMLHFHTAPIDPDTSSAFLQGWISTLEVEGDATQRPMYSSNGADPTWWTFPLRPGLSIGIDDSGETGAFRLGFESDAGFDDVDVEAEIWLCHPARPEWPSQEGCPQGGAAPLYRGTASTPSMAPGATWVAEGDLLATPFAGRYPYEEGMSLWSKVAFNASRFDQAGHPLAPRFVPAESFVHLPLLDFRAVPESLELGGRIEAGVHAVPAIGGWVFIQASPDVDRVLLVGATPVEVARQVTDREGVWIEVDGPLEGPVESVIAVAYDRSGQIIAMAPISLAIDEDAVPQRPPARLTDDHAAGGPAPVMLLVGLLLVLRRWL